MKRCRWCNEKNEKYVLYHDSEWGKLNLDDHHLFEMLILELMQAGLSWECVLNKRENFRAALDDFNPNVIAEYTDEKIESLLQDKGLIRNKRKMEACRNNARIFLQIAKDFDSFGNYLKTYWNGKVIHDSISTTNLLSDEISADLKSRGMKFCGSTIIYSFLQAVGIIDSHEENCFLHTK